MISPPIIDPTTTLKRAGLGDGVALRALAVEAHTGAMKAVGATRVALLAEALTFARLLAVNSSADDARAVVRLFSDLADAFRHLGENEAADGCDARVLLFAGTLADNGDDEMAQLVMASGSMSAAVHLKAKQLQEMDRR